MVWVGGVRKMEENEENLKEVFSGFVVLSECFWQLYIFCNHKNHE